MTSSSQNGIDLLRFRERVIVPMLTSNVQDESTIRDALNPIKGA